MLNGEKSKAHKRADKKLDNILKYLNAEFGESAVDNFLERVYYFFEIIVDFPRIGLLKDEEKLIYGFVLEHEVKVFYRFNDKEVVIINFFDNRNDPRKKF